MSSQAYRVGLVVDRRFGDRILKLFRHFHLWVVRSPINSPAIAKAWAASGPSDDQLEQGVTSFLAGETETPHQMCERIAETIDEHHGEFAHDPPWSEIEVFGAFLTERLREVFRELGATSFVPTEHGFVARR